ncbi:MAG: MoxR family ATPase, partial [Candidatus Methanomethylicia archaeon]|nr:MoxR family ATPase [Candidatus Methanomethylicia archaeon]
MLFSSEEQGGLAPERAKWGLLAKDRGMVVVRWHVKWHFRNFPSGIICGSRHGRESLYQRGSICRTLRGISISIEEVESIKKSFRIVDRTEELRDAIAAIRAKRNVLIEGPVGVGKTVIAEALARFFNRRIFRIDGDERYTEQKMIGYFDPPLVMEKGYCREAFLEGPLTEAMSSGGFLFINELNRMPEGTQNVLLPAMDERKITIPRIGTIVAKEGFAVIATQNPEEYIGTSRLSEAMKDRFVWIRLGYQSEEDEIAITEKETCAGDPELVRVAVRIVRKTRGNPDIRRGASVRGAIDMVALVQQSS